jgi:RHS repeat-associated protein
VQEHSNTQRTPYLYTGKELDEETGLYYYGARYYDPRTSVWASTDGIFAQYLDGEPQDGVYEPKNLGLYSYTYNNPTKYTDPDGNFGVVGFFIGAGIEVIAQVATTGKVNDWTAVGVSGVVGIVTGGVAGRLATNAAKGMITTTRAVTITAATGGAASGAGSVATDALKGDEINLNKAAVAGVAGTIGAGAGAKITNAGTRALEKMSEKGGILQHMAETTRSSQVGKGAEVTTTMSQEVATKATDIATSTAGKKMEILVVGESND